jgi:DNA repair protein RadD
MACGVQHSIHLWDEFRRSGVLAEHIDGSTPIPERDRILDQLAKGKIDVVCNAMVLVEGWDCPAVSCLVLARPTKSLGLYRQIIGRGLRPFPGKTECLILDHSGATFQHGFAEDPIDWVLSENDWAVNRKHALRGSGDGPGTLMSCPECSAAMTRGKPCGGCGWRPQRRGEAVEVIDGDLAQVSRSGTTQANVYAPDDKMKWHQQLLYIAREKGYKDGWAAMKAKEKFGHWPAAKPWALPPPIPPTDAVRSWVRSRQIAYAKAMDAQRRRAP